MSGMPQLSVAGGGYEVLLAGSGQEALVIFATHHILISQFSIMQCRIMQCRTSTEVSWHRD
jgi:hypothetical protein